VNIGFQKKKTRQTDRQTHRQRHCRVKERW
jgi:hypothetical protein